MGWGMHSGLGYAQRVGDAPAHQRTKLLESWLNGRQCESNSHYPTYGDNIQAALLGPSRPCCLPPTAVQPGCHAVPRPLGFASHQWLPDTVRDCAPPDLGRVRLVLALSSPTASQIATSAAAASTPTRHTKRILPVRMPHRTSAWQCHCGTCHPPCVVLHGCGPRQPATHLLDRPSTCC